MFIPRGQPDNWQNTKPLTAEFANGREDAEKSGMHRHVGLEFAVESAGIAAARRVFLTIRVRL
jgi:hypothetical protein